MQQILRNLIENSVKQTFEEIGDKKSGLMFSAGLDSTLLAKISQKLGFSPTLISLITENSKDIDFIKKTSSFLDLSLEIYKPSPGDFIPAIQTVKSILDQIGIEKSLMQISLGVCDYLAFSFAKKKGIEALLSGQGPDELFAGYYKFSTVPLHSLQEVLDKELERLSKVDVKRDCAVVNFFGLKLYTPYLDGRIIAFAKELPVEYKIHKGENKFILRQVASTCGLPDFIVTRPKKAMQYSTGIQKQVKNLL